jgi:hypothetical protein
MEPMHILNAIEVDLQKRQGREEDDADKRTKTMAHHTQL